MRHLTLFLVLWCASLELQAQQSPTDNRLPKELHHFSFTDNEPPDEVEALNIIRTSHNSELSKNFENPSPFEVLRMEWHATISLKDADYFLFLFDSKPRINPGTTPRVLVLFDTRYQVKTWARFDCNPASNFGYGTIVQQRTGSQLGPKTYFVTVNTTDPYGNWNGNLFFEKYAISPDHMDKLGESLELTSIRD